MKKLFALLVCVLLVFTLVSCGDDPCQHRDADDNSLCDKCGESYTDGKDIDDSTPCSHRDADDNSLCDKCGESYTDGKDIDDSTPCSHRDADDNSLCDKCGESYTDGKDIDDSTPCSHRDADDNSLCDKCGESYTDGKDLPDEHTHSYTVKNTDSKYLDKAADCENAATYFYSCSCGAKGTTTFTHGNANGHSFGKWYEIITPDCTKEGAEEHECTVCHIKEKQTIPELGHSHQATIEENRVEATCTEEGGYDSVVYCYVCGTELKRSYNVIFPKGHTAVIDKAVPATCVNTGLTEGSHCSVCKEVLVSQTIIKILEHDYSEKIVAAAYIKSASTCYSPATYYYSCKCGEKGTNFFATGDILSHNYSSYVLREEATSNSYGLKVRTCEICKHEDAVSLIYCSTCDGDGKTQGTVSCSNCNGNGTKYSKCIRCNGTGGKVFNGYVTCVICSGSGYVVSGFGSTMRCSCGGDGKVENYTTCADCNGYGGKNNTCTVCFGSGTKSATVNCSRCNAAGYYEALVISYNANGGYGAPAKQNKTGASCNLSTVKPYRNGYMFIGWSTPDKTMVYEPGDAYSGGEITLFALWLPKCEICNGAGEIATTYTCDICAGDGQYTSTTRHCNNCSSSHVVLHTTGTGSFYCCNNCGSFNVSVSSNVVACHNCTNGIATKYEKCTACNEKGYLGSLSDCTIDLTSTSHDYVYHEAKEPTCNEVGWDAYYTCSCCGFSGYIENPANGHNFEDWYQIKAPYCVTTGMEERECSVCHIKETKNVNALGHSPKTAVEENRVEATCTEDGHYDTVVYCNRCDVELLRENKTIEKLGHSPKTAVEENRVEATCTEDGHYDTVVYCNRCDGEVSRTTETLTKLGHSPKSAVEENRVEATCTEDGHYDTVVYCNRCDGEVSRTTETLTKLGHSPKTAVEENRVEPTCDVGGHYDTVVYCNRCDGEVSRTNTTLAAIGQHNVIDGKCEHCGVSESSAGLQYYQNSDGTYILIGVGTCKDTDIIVGIYNNRSVTSINSYALQECTSLTSVTIDNCVTNIGEGAFALCTSLTSVTIGNSVANIDETAFVVCIKLSNITVDENNGFYKSIEGNLYSKDEKTLIQYSVGKTNTVFTIPDSVTNIGNYAFCYCTSLTSVTIGDSVTSIGDNVFQVCTNLTSVTIGDSVTSIGDSAFSGCTSLTNINVSENNSAYKSIDGNLYSKDGKTLILYAMGKKDTSFTIPDSVTSIGNNAFYSCTSLTSVTIPDSVTSIGDYAFDSCEGLTSVTIPNSVTSIGNSAFYNCTGLTDVYYSGSKEEWEIIVGNDAFASRITTHFDYVKE